MLEAFDSGALEAVAAGIGADLAVASSSGGGQFQVDLQSLHDYYYKVYEIWQRLNRHASSLPTDPFSVACVNTGQIPGVADAIKSTVNGALGAEESMRQALNAVRHNLARHLQALHDVYVAYVNTDSQGASKLNQAGSPRAASVQLHLPGAAKPHTASTPSWVAGLVSGTEA